MLNRGYFGIVQCTHNHFHLLHRLASVSTTVHLVQFSCRSNLCPCPLSTHRQSHCVSSSPVRAHIPQSHDVVLDLSPQIVLNLHARKLRRKVLARAFLQAADLRPRLDVKACHDAL